MFENIGSFFKKIMKTEQKELLVEATSKDAAKERLHIVLMQDRANVSADFLELMKQEIIDVIKKYIVIDEEQIDVRLTNQENEDGTTGVPALYANIPIVNIRNDIKGEYLNQDSKKEIKKNENNFADSNLSRENNIDLQNHELQKEGIPKDENNIEITQNNSYDDEENDNDITFDDLLKVAEEDGRKKIDNKVKTGAKKTIPEEIPNSQEISKNTTKTTKKSTKKKTKKTTNNSKSKKNKEDCK